MTFEEIAQAIQIQEADQGLIVGNLQARRLAAQAIMEGFRNICEAKQSISDLKRTENCLFTARGYEVDWECLSWAVYMYVPIQAPEEIREIIYKWYEED